MPSVFLNNTICKMVKWSFTIKQVPIAPLVAVVVSFGKQVQEYTLALCVTKSWIMSLELRPSQQFLSGVLLRFDVMGVVAVVVMGVVTGVVIGVIGFVMGFNMSVVLSVVTGVVIGVVVGFVAE